MNITGQREGRYFRKESLYIVGLSALAASVYICWPVTVLIMVILGIYIDATRPNYPTA